MLGEGRQLGPLPFASGKGTLINTCKIMCGYTYGIWPMQLLLQLHYTGL